MDTGTVYVIEGDEGAAGAPGAPASESRVTELLSGRELRWVPRCRCTCLSSCTRALPSSAAALCKVVARLPT